METRRAGPAVLVSVLITCYRRREFLPTAVASVIASSGARQREVVVVTDGIDAGLGAAWRRDGVDVLVADLPIVGDMIRAGLERCHGDVVCFLDDDDWFDPQKLDVVQGAFTADPDLTLLRTGFEAVDEAGRPLQTLGRILPQPRRSYVLDAHRMTAVQRAWVVRNRAYGNLSTLCVRRAALNARAEELTHIEAATDGSVAALMLDEGGRHRFDPRRLTRRRVGTSHRSLGKAEEGDRAVRTFEYLGRRVQHPSARWYAKLMLSWARVDAFLNSREGHLSLDDWLAYVWFHLPRTDASTWEAEAWSLARLVAPQLATAAYVRRSRRAA